METASKLRSVAEARAWRNGVRGPVVFTNGVFDLLHRGHIEYLEAARALGAALVVGVNSDRSAGLLGKGAGRPFVTAANRARLLAALGAVDAVVVFDEATPLELIAAIRPDVLVKGGDYTRETIVGADVVEAAGGIVTTIPLVADHSTTQLVERILDSHR